MLRKLILFCVVAACAMSVGCGTEESAVSVPASASISSSISPAPAPVSLAKRSDVPKKINRPPVIVSTDASVYNVRAGGKRLVYYIPDGEVGKLNMNVSGHVLTRDPDGDDLKYSAIGAPAGFHFGAMDGFPGSWIWEPRSDQAGTYDVIIVVSDGALEAKTAIKIVAAPIHPPVISPETPSELKVKKGYTLTSSVEAHDPDCPCAPLAYRVVRSPVGLELEPDRLARNVYAFTPTATGRFEVEFEVRSFDDMVATHRVAIVVE